MRKLLMIAIIAMTASCSKGQLLPPEQPPIPVNKLNEMIKFLDNNSDRIQVTNSPLFFNWSLKAAKLDGKDIIYEGIRYMYVPAHSNIVPSIIQMQDTSYRIFEFQQSEWCGFDVYKFFTTNVIIKAGDKEFVWTNAPIQYYIHRSNYNPAYQWSIPQQIRITLNLKRKL